MVKMLHINVHRIGGFQTQQCNVAATLDVKEKHGNIQWQLVWLHILAELHMCHISANHSFSTGSHCDMFVQELLLRVGVLGHVVPLLFGFDPTQDPKAQPDHFDYTGTQRTHGAAFRDLGMQRSNMQVCAYCLCRVSCMLCFFRSKHGSRRSLRILYGMQIMHLIFTLHFGVV